MRSVTDILVLQLENGVIQQDLNSQILRLMLLLFCVNTKNSNFNENKDNDFFVLSKGPFEVWGVQGDPKSESRCCLSLHFDYANSYVLGNEKEICNSESKNTKILYLVITLKKIFELLLKIVAFMMFWWMIEILLESTLLTLKKI